MKDLVRARERFAPAQRVHVVVRKEDIAAERLEGRVAIVLDILFATTTIVTALAGVPFFLWVLRRAKNQGYW